MILYSIYSSLMAPAIAVLAVLWKTAIPTGTILLVAMPFLWGIARLGCRFNQRYFSRTSFWALSRHRELYDHPTSRPSRMS